MRVLLIEDDEKTASFIKKGLKEAGYVVEHAADGEEGLYLGTTASFDAAVIDIMLPKMDGLSLIEQMRKKKITTPVIVLSAKRSVDDRIKGLYAGGDDYLVKPFSFSELLARIHTLIRRTTLSGESTRIEVADLSLDLLSRKVTRSGKEMDLQPKEFSLLEYLMRNRGRVVTKTMIMEHVWDWDFDPQTNVVEVRICNLRDKIDRPFEKKMIHTIRGIGYVLEERD
jgi:two-component system OmpR family response regulator